MWKEVVFGDEGFPSMMGTRSTETSVVSFLSTRLKRLQKFFQLKVQILNTFKLLLTGRMRNLSCNC
jgi:hypothetical protein